MNFTWLVQLNVPTLGLLIDLQNMKNNYKSRSTQKKVKNKKIVGTIILILNY